MNCYVLFFTAVVQFAPLSFEKIQRIKRRRMREKEMWEIIKDMVIFFILILIVWAIAYGQIDDDAYRMKHLLHETVIEDLSTSLEPEGFSTVNARRGDVC